VNIDPDVLIAEFHASHDQQSHGNRGGRQVSAGLVKDGSTVVYRAAEARTAPSKMVDGERFIVTSVTRTAAGSVSADGRGSVESMTGLGYKGGIGPTYQSDTKITVVDPDEELAAATVEFHGNHDQSSHGNWARGGEVGLPPGAQEISATPESRALAAPIAARAAAIEPALSTQLAQLVGDADPQRYESPPPAELFGYEYRLKATEKIAEKIERVMVEDGLTREEAAANIKDSVRYTVHFSEDDFGDAAQQVVNELRADPEVDKVLVKNTWPPEKGIAYKGVNANVYRKDGFVYEIQFHTPESQVVKDEMHVLYEEQRVLWPSNPRWQELEDQMQAMGNSQPTPRDATKVFRLASKDRPRPPRRGFRVASGATMTVERR
jgi:hypothetical protein